MAAELWGHRLVRYTVGPLAHATLLVMALAKVRSSRLARLFLLANAGACIGLVVQTPAADLAEDPSAAERARRLLSKASAAGGQVMFLQGVALGGMVRYARGDRSTMWSTVER